MIRSIGVRALPVLIALAFVLPVVWLLTTAYKAPTDIFGVPPRLLFSPTLSNFRGLFQFFDVPELVLNTVIISIVATILAVALGTPCAYALARLNSPYASLVAYFFLAVRMVPPVAILIPFYLMMRDIGLLGTWWAAILIDAAQSTCFVIWMMYGYFRVIPNEIEEAAQVDGCSNWVRFWRIAVPVVRPGLVASCLFCIIFAWNGFLFPAFLTNSETRPLAVAMISAFGTLEITWGTMGALAHFSVLPILVMTLVLNKYFVSGLTRGIH